MSLTEEILSANTKGTLLNTIVEITYDQRDNLANALSELHNLGEIDFLDAYGPNHLNTVSGHLFYNSLDVFCRALPQLQCSTMDAAYICDVLFEKGSGDPAASEVYGALRMWFQRSLERIEEGLELIRRDTEIQTGITRSVLLAGAKYDVRRFAEEALILSRHSQSRIRSDALSALGRMQLGGEKQILVLTFERFIEVIESRESDQDMANAIQAALCQFDVHGKTLVSKVESLLLKACEGEGPITRLAVAVGLQTHREIITDVMISSAFKIIGYTKKSESRTIKSIDSMLYQWDIDMDRQRVLGLLSTLLAHSEDAIDLEQLSSFRHKLAEHTGDILGWYIVSLLLTGDHKLCLSAIHLLPYHDPPGGLDIDLKPFNLDSSWVLFLARKVIGYCVVNWKGASALLLSCLRVVPDTNRTELEELVQEHFLINYPGAIEWLKTTIIPNDSAGSSVNNLSSVLAEYLDGVRQCGLCDAFRPNVREVQLQNNRQTDLYRETQKEIEQHSVVKEIFPQSLLLYGTGTIAYIFTDGNQPPHRQELPLESYFHSIELSRLNIINPVGLQYTIYRFRSEIPPS